MKFTDSHCHLDDNCFSQQLPDLLSQCDLHNISRIIIPSISPDNFQKVLSLTKQHHQNPIDLYCTLGIHPWFIKHLSISDLEKLSLLIIQEKQHIVGIGEIGLDGATSKHAAQFGQTPEENFKQQQLFFDYQLNLAQRNAMPVIIHHRQSHHHIVPFLKHYQLAKSGIIHGFTGSYQQAKDYIDLGFKLGVGSSISFSRAKKTINTFKRLPIEYLVLETDAPSMPLSHEIESNSTKLYQNNSSKSPANSPLNIPVIFQLLVNITGVDPLVLANQLERNVDDIFLT
ncbi:TatD family hydrolase [Litorilituus lipolyticus]|uniref:TatD family deoxyribonuclease n=1 Tax=Litorilituus lipolyticus TaxID=2491017 RepID=A0A502LBG4_9GAMM|nr:TatD family hydrolase [Litorilituus lipolyticus]TPH19323.1 TatD family deoxyribonuclease [Litorilituus lipolyticus]